jgi:hypothetical protein
MSFNLTVSISRNIFKGQNNATTTLMHSCFRSTSAKRFFLNGRTCVLLSFSMHYETARIMTSLRALATPKMGSLGFPSYISCPLQLGPAAFPVRAMNLGFPEAFAYGLATGKVSSLKQHQSFTAMCRLYTNVGVSHPVAGKLVFLTMLLKHSSFFLLVSFATFASFGAGSSCKTSHFHRNLATQTALEEVIQCQ